MPTVEVHLVRRRPLARGDRIQPRRERPQKLHERIGVERIGGVFRDQVEEMPGADVGGEIPGGAVHTRR